MKVIIDIECNALHKPDKIWCVVCKDIDTNEYYIFRNLTTDVEERQRFITFDKCVDLYIGHHILGYDWPILDQLILGSDRPVEQFLDTLIISKMENYSRAGHSIEDFGVEFNLEKGSFNDFSKYSDAMVTYCIRDVDITHLVYNKFSEWINRPSHRASITLEHAFQLVVNQLTENGFSFNTVKAQKLLDKVTEELKELDDKILAAFPPRETLVKEFIPRATKFGTISLSSIPVSLRGNVAEYEVGQTYRQTKYVEFNPASHKQIIEVLSEAKWSPIDKTKTHLDYLRELQRAKYSNVPISDVDLSNELVDNISKLKRLEKFGWKINENNLSTLPPSAPLGAKLLAKRIMLESRRRTLTEWLTLVTPDNRIHGRFYGIGAWTHRMAHQQPNTANIPNEFDTAGNKKLLGKEMRALWQAPKNRLLVGVDAEGIQLRVFAHYINDAEFTASLVNGKKEDKSDPHSLNQRILGEVCRSRDAAKRFVFALLLGAGMGKLREILGCELDEAKAALERLIVRYEGFGILKRDVIPSDAKRGWFTGLDGRTVPIPSDTIGGRQHLAMSGYLQNGEAVIMKRATLKWHSKLFDLNSSLVNMVHDEWQTEVPNDFQKALYIAKIQAESLEEVGRELNLKCPLAGSYWNDKVRDYTIGNNWYQTH